MSFNFNDTVHGVIFNLDIHLGVLLVRHVEKFSGEVKKLIFKEGDLPERRFSEKLNNGRDFAVDGSFSNNFSG